MSTDASRPMDPGKARRLPNRALPHIFCGIFAPTILQGTATTTTGNQATNQKPAREWIFQAFQCFHQGHHHVSKHHFRSPFSTKQQRHALSAWMISQEAAITTDGGYSSIVVHFLSEVRPTLRSSRNALRTPSPGKVVLEPVDTGGALVVPCLTNLKLLFLTKQSVLSHVTVVLKLIHILQLLLQLLLLFLRNA